MRKRTHSIDMICMLLLLVLFLSLALLLVMIGSNIYQVTVNRAEENAQIRTSCAYITNKIHANDVKNAISIKLIDGIKVLSLKQRYEGDVYEDLIFCYDGSVREALVKENAEFDLSYGDSLFPAKDMEIKYHEEEQMLTILVTGIDDFQQMFEIALRSGE